MRGFIKIIKALLTKEKRLIDNGKVFLARLFSLVVLLFVDLLISIYYVAVVLLSKLQNGSYKSVHLNFWWTIPLGILLVLIMPIIMNFNDESFIYSEKVKIFWNVILVPSTNKFKLKKLIFHFIGCIVFTILFILAMYLSKYCLGVYTLNNLNLNIITQQGFVLSVTIYITAGILLLPEKTDVQKSNKLYYKLILWSYALIVAISYTTGKISGNNQPSDAVYSVIVLLVAIERMLNCYKELNIMYEKGIKI